MTIPGDIDSEAIRLLKKADWPWDGFEKAFIEARDPKQETTEDYRGRALARISYAELRDHGLAGKASTEERDAGIKWLRKKLTATT
jgi:hypothetical protein